MQTGSASRAFQQAWGNLKPNLMVAKEAISWKEGSVPWLERFRQ
jgi:hypothetical protein